MASKPPSSKKRKCGNSCVAYGCRNSGSSGVGMYNFPKDPERRRQWTLHVQRTRADFVYKEKCILRLCGEHFTEDQFDSSIDRKLAMGFRNKECGRVLLPTAIPTKFVRPNTVPGVCSTPKSRKSSPIEKRDHQKIIEELLLQSESHSVPTVATSTCTSDFEDASVLSELEPTDVLELVLEEKMETFEKVTLTKPNMQDFSCQFSGVEKEEFSCQFSGVTKDFSCQFPEDSLLLLETNQFLRSDTFTSEQQSSLTGKDLFSVGDEEFEPDEECEDTEYDLSPVTGQWPPKNNFIL